MLEGRRVHIQGTVQGVGFRPWVCRLARALGLTGSVWNDAAGVVIEAFGPPAALDDFLAHLEAQPPPAARLAALSARAIAAEHLPSFEIAHSGEGAERRVTIPPDLPTCEACLAELFDPTNRRHRYPFTNCTGCGPRYTITRALPYDRPATTMAPFRMCPACQAEYDCVEDRRFHAQPNACPACGPRLALLTPAGEPLAPPDPLAAAAAALLEGRVVALKGLGGFHLACDATRQDAVATLRARKGRDEKPFALMVRDVAAARALAHLSAPEEALLGGVERPIVLVRRREGAALAPGVAPGLARLGLMLPYTPLHHLLVAQAGRPLVMTSANLSEEPIVKDNAEALARLGGIADLLLVHDRDIEARADDSVAAVVAGRPLTLRRSRGYVARGVHLPRRVARPVLACGAHLKNTFCLAVGDSAYLSAHVGDLENLETLGAYEEAVARMERLLALRPEVVAHDLHPDYLSTRYALARAGVAHVAVQHHHAHVVSALTQAGLAGPVLGLAWDGTGAGPDGTSWGGELLLADATSYQRLATFRPLALAGGDRAVREVWRAALALLEDAFAGELPLEALSLFRTLRAQDVALVRRMVQQGVHAPRAHGVGRYFDAVGALALGRTHARYEGQVAIALEQAVDAAERGHYPFTLHTASQPWTVDLRPAVRRLVGDVVEGRPAGVVSARFHHTLVEVARTLLAEAARSHPGLPIVLSGGCFQNARLTEGIVSALRGVGEVHLHGEVPCGDGGLALGQAVVADALARTL